MTDSRHGRLIVLCGPAGVGKGTVLGRVREQHPQIWLSVSNNFSIAFLHFF